MHDAAVIMKALATLTETLSAVTRQVTDISRRQSRLMMETDALRVAMATALEDLPEAREKVIRRLEGDAQDFFPPDTGPLDPAWREGLEQAARGFAEGIRRRSPPGQLGSHTPPAGEV